LKLNILLPASSAPWAGITLQELKTADGHPFSLITLDMYSLSGFKAHKKKAFVLEQSETLHRLKQ